MNKSHEPRAIVTGASSGIGRAAALLLAENGWKVLAAARRADRLETLAAQAEGRIIPLAIDITETDAPRHLMSAAQNELDGLDLLVNNAGCSWIGDFAEMPDEQLDRVIDLNVRSLMRLSRAAIPLLEQSERAQIINVASIVAHVPLATIAVYCATKAAVVMFTRVLAKELAPRKIRVNALSPSGTNTEIFEKSGGSSTDSSQFIPPEDQARMILELTRLPAGIDVVEIVSDQRFNGP